MNKLIQKILSLYLFTVSILQTHALPKLKLVKHSGGYDTPVAIVDPKDGTNRLFVVERGGRIIIVSANGKNKLSNPFIDLSSSLGPCTGYCAERGLLGLAFHPNYKNNGYFYVNYTQKGSDSVLRTIVSRFEVNPNNQNTADSGSELKLLQFEQPFSNHNGGDLHFGHDGYLYISSGDGGAADDPQGNGQKLNTLLGKLLRIDVDATSPGKNYAIPSTNPFLSNPDALDEIWAYGLRNPWRFSFCRTSGALYIGDVGQNLYEEINYRLPNSPGGENYGWNTMEGFHCFNPATNCNTDGLVMPIIEYSHDVGCSVTGGYNYRGPIVKLRDTYIYGDFCSGIIWGAKRTNPMGSDPWTTQVLLTKANLGISSFGENANGVVFVVGMFAGEIYKIAPCRDSTTYYYQYPKRKCTWIKEKPWRKQQFCKKWIVKKKCPVTCNSCNI